MNLQFTDSSFRSFIENDVVTRFKEYVTWDTQSSSKSTQTPSTPGQILFLKHLQSELDCLKIRNFLDEKTGHLYAYLSSNPSQFSFYGHVDTSEEVSGHNVVPLEYVVTGHDIHLPFDNTVIPSSQLQKYKDQKIITSSGNTLLGADDKCAVAELMTFCTIVKDEDLPITVVFTPDEEIMKSISNISVERVEAKRGISLDGNELGSYSSENFNAISARITIECRNASCALFDFFGAMPHKHPSNTKDRSGFVLCTGFSGKGNEASAKFIIRSFEEDELNNFVVQMENLCDTIKTKYTGKIVFEKVRTYSNVRNFLKNDEIEKMLCGAMEEVGVKPIKIPFRGGFDACVLAEKGIDAINMFSGGINFHSKREFAVVESMVKAVEIVVNIARKFSTKQVN
ncbi:peptidase t, putative [Entamoeba invadens IP1]|uniref:Peptidase t, putative n=1 Tax=Entamoeba invadens IP1 TaxID=370355 RepID=A0A0A1TY69_ENTIV|nr:peptidase t, putative [Entamoeba invadens IP1]ELP84480.1 peptidase t, putative [Entamoeba invadens IP1]|eukprot:XP_004183826.1 peptidase t, putative [Entamoeba invadens IP1]